jgi:ferritin-like metal-binding protein YciE
MENAIEERIQSRLKQITIEHAKIQFQHHLEETQRQKERLKQVIRSHDGIPTDVKADLPILKPNTLDLVRDNLIPSSSTTSNSSKPSSHSMDSSQDTNKSLVESIVNETDNVRLAAEKQLTETEHDATIEHAEIIKYRMLLEIAKVSGANDAIPVIMQNLKEEEDMADWIHKNMPKMLLRLWPQIEVSAGARTTTEA